MPKGYANQEVGEIDPKRCGWCHPAQSKRTKCACGNVVTLCKAGTQCSCGRVHRKDPTRSAFGSTGLQPVRPGGRGGCPGC